MHHNIVYFMSISQIVCHDSIFLLSFFLKLNLCQDDDIDEISGSKRTLFSIFQSVIKTRYLNC